MVPEAKMALLLFSVGFIAIVIGLIKNHYEKTKD